MKIFDRIRPWPHKINFVDERNVVVGYDMERCCCETFGWYIADHITSKIKKRDVPDVEAYRFNTKFIHKLPELDGLKIVVFQMLALHKPDLFLHLYNDHNGYYAHGFEFKVNDSITEVGDL